MQSSNGVVEHGVCREQVELDSGNGTTLAVLAWESRGGGAMQATGPTKNLLGFEGQSQGCSTKNPENLKRVIHFFS